MAFHPLKKSENKRENYQGIVVGVHKDGIHYDIQMTGGKQVIRNVHREAIFTPGTERTLEVARGNLFERNDSFRADIVILPHHIANESFKSFLFAGCKRSFVGSRIMAYDFLEKWPSFPSFSLRHIDANVYDNDRFHTTVDKTQRLYCYEHVVSHHHASVLLSSPFHTFVFCLKTIKRRVATEASCRKTESWRRHLRERREV